MDKILIVDDNEQITRVLRTYAEQEGYNVDVALDGFRAWQMFQAHNYDLVLLDIMLPHINGLDLLRMIREISQVPIIMITAKKEEYDRIIGLDYGADDYITKPFSAREVMARIRALLRRIKPNVGVAEEDIQKGNLKLDLKGYLASVDELDLNLTKKEFELLWTLVTHENQVMSRDQLLDLIWGDDYFGDDRTIDSHVKRIRTKLNLAKYDSYEISTVRGVGYKFVKKLSQDEK